MYCLFRFIVLVFVISLLHAKAIVVDDLENRSEFNEKELIYACLDENKRACDTLISSDLPSVDECNEDTSCIVIAHIYMNAKKHENAIPYLKKSCYFGILEACFEYGLSYEIIGDYTQANAIYKRSCNQGFMSSCYNLAMLYVNGLGVKANIQKANRIFFEACINNEEQSCYNLAISYKDGIGVKADRLKARDFFKKACDLGMELGCKEYKIINAADFSITIKDHLKQQ